MGKPKFKSKRNGGRPMIGVSRRGISLKENDIDFFKKFGYGSLTRGIRRAADILRGLNIV